VTVTRHTLRAVGVAIGSEPVPYRLDYRLTTTRSFITSRVLVTASGEGWSRRLDLIRCRHGGWGITTRTEGAVDLPPAGGDARHLTGALDADLGLSPLFNTMPVLRHALLSGGSARDLLMAWISVPDLHVEPSQQRYTHLAATPTGHQVISFETIGAADAFQADVTFDAAGLVVNYPGIARRIG
jgi:uncharacterized protein